MTHPAKRERVGAIAVVAMAFIVAGCFVNQAPDPCAVKVSADEQAVRRVLEPPYRAHSGPGRDPVVLVLSAADWSRMDVRLRTPMGGEYSTFLTREEIEANGFMEITPEDRGLSLDHHGVWRVRVSDPESGCVSEFSVEVVP